MKENRKLWQYDYTDDQLVNIRLAIDWQVCHVLDRLKREHGISTTCDYILAELLASLYADEITERIIHRVKKFLPFD